MRSNIDIDGKLLQDVMRSGGFTSKKDAVEAALRALIRHHEQLKNLKLLGKAAWEGDLDAMRTSKHPAQTR